MAIKDYLNIKYTTPRYQRLVKKLRKNKLKKLFKEGTKAAINGWLQIPSSFFA